MSESGHGGALNSSVLVLNRMYIAVHVIHVRRAICLLCRNLAEVIHIDAGHYTNHDFESWLAVSELNALDKQPEQDWIRSIHFELQVPRDVDLTASTVNDGDVIVKDVSGQYSVHNVNGTVEMTNVDGSGTAKTVNGELKVFFRGNPQNNSSFSTINGDVDLYFLPKFSADLRFKTFNGEIYSDFQMSSLPPRQPEAEHTAGKFVFRADRFTGGRVAAGGPEIKIETLNGDIHIRERHD